MSQKVRETRENIEEGMMCLVDLLDGRTLLWGTARSTTREAAWGSTSREASGSTTSTGVQLLDDGVGDTLELLLLLLVLLLRGLLRVVEPLDGLVNVGLEGLLVLWRELVGGGRVGESVTQVVGVRLETVLGLDT